MFLKRYSLLLLFFIIPVTEVSAQLIEGVVRDAESLEPLLGANIVQVQTSNGASTDNQGTFSFQLIQDGPLRIEVSYLGYRTQEILIEDPAQFLEIDLHQHVIQSGEVFVRALRVDESNPIAYSNVTREEIERKNLGQDIPYLVSSTPSVVTTSDAGAGIGYTGIRIRGVDPARINVSINGIPLNDAESHGVWWVNMPDLASSVENIQIQRGVGSSTHGAGAFGATMNLQTARMEQNPYGQVNTTVGSFNTQKYNVLLGSGRVGNGWKFEGRLSKVTSDGFIDRASSDLKSFYLSGSREGDRSLFKVDVFSGQERTYQAWNGIPEPILNDDAGQLEHYLTQLWITGDEAERMRENLGNRQFNEYTYENQVDNYQQDHYQIHYSYQLTDNWLLNSSLHYTYGRGYYEQYRNDDQLETYNIEPIEMGGETITSSDLIRRRWLDNHFYGTVISTEYRFENRWKLTVGGGYNEYDGDHFGEVIWARFAGDSEHEDRYYDNNGFKTDFNLYGKFNYYLTEALSSYVDLQYRSVTYRFLGKSVEEVNGEQQAVDLSQRVHIDFINPKAGLVYRLDNNQRVFASLSVGGKEPTRNDYVESTLDSRPDPERLLDYEAGYHANFDRFSAGVNLYYMDYKDQLILTGALNDVGAYVRENVSDSYRAGIELQGSARLLSEITVDANATFSKNKIQEYTRYLDDFDEGGQNSDVYEDADIAFSPNFISNITLLYQKGGLTGAITNKYVSRQYLDNTQTESRSIDPYFIQDLRISYSFDRISFLGSLSATLQVNNLLDHHYVSNGYTFGWIAGGEEQHFNYYYPQAGRNVLFKVQAGF